MKRTAKILSAGTIILVFAAATTFALTDTATHDVEITVAEVALIGLNNTTLVTLNTVAPGSAGADPTGSSDTGKTVQYTSLNATGFTRDIEADIDAATPGGTSLSLACDPGGGVAGTTAGAVTLSTTPAAIVTGIGSYASTATGPTLTYQLNVTAVGSLVVGTVGTVTVTLTLAEDG